MRKEEKSRDDEIREIVLACIDQRGVATFREIQRALGSTVMTQTIACNLMIEEGLIVKIGFGRSTKYARA